MQTEKWTKISNDQELKNGIFSVTLVRSGGVFTAISKVELTAKMQARYGRHIQVLDWQQTPTDMTVRVKAGNPAKPKEGYSSEDYSKENSSSEILPLVIFSAASLIGLFLIWKITANVKETMQYFEKISQTTAGTITALSLATGSVLVPIAVVAVVWLVTRPKNSSQKGVV